MKSPKQMKPPKPKMKPPKHRNSIMCLHNSIVSTWICTEIINRHGETAKIINLLWCSSKFWCFHHYVNNILKSPKHALLLTWSLRNTHNPFLHYHCYLIDSDELSVESYCHIINSHWILFSVYSSTYYCSFLSF